MTYDDWASFFAEHAQPEPESAEGGEGAAVPSPISAEREGAPCSAPMSYSETISAEEFRAAIAKAGLSITGSASVLGVSVRQAMRYAAGQTIDPPTRKLVRLLGRGKVSAWLMSRL